MRGIFRETLRATNLSAFWLFRGTGAIEKRLVRFVAQSSNLDADCYALTALLGRSRCCFYRYHADHLEVGTVID